MPYFAKINHDSKVISLLSCASIDDILIQQIGEGETYVPITQTQADEYRLTGNALFIDNVFTVCPHVTEMQDRNIEDVRTEKIRMLERYTPEFIAYNNGIARYTREKQSSFHGIYIRCERLSRLSGTSEEVKAACEAKIALIESVYTWIESVLARHYVHLNALKNATTLEELDAVTWDYSDLNTTDPDVWLEHVI
jgi:hypothetical protein